MWFISGKREGQSQRKWKKAHENGKGKRVNGNGRWCWIIAEKSEEGVAKTGGLEMKERNEGEGEWKKEEIKSLF